MKAIPIKEPIEKYSLKSLFLGITRKCNLKCEHCLCGEAQNLTISKKVIDRMFEQIENATNITLTGGEPLLAVDMIEYFFRKLKQSQWKPLYIDIVTNGTIKNEKIIDVFADYALYNKNIEFGFLVSADDFHPDIKKQKECIKFYENICRRKKISKIHLNLHRQDKIGKYLSCEGRAKKYIKTNYEKLINEGYKFMYSMDLEYPHKLNIIDNNDIIYCNDDDFKQSKNTIACCISVEANGNISIVQNFDYKYTDEHSIGNILSGNFKEMIDKYQSKAICTCTELQEYTNFKTAFNWMPCNDKDTAFAVLLYKIKCEKIFNLRKLAQREFPKIPTFVIIQKIKMPTDDEWVEILGNMYLKTHYQPPGKAEDAYKMLNNKNLYFVFPYDIYNYYEEDILDSCLFQELAELDLEYQNNSK